jgi:hypothetical protein
MNWPEWSGLAAGLAAAGFGIARKVMSGSSGDDEHSQEQTGNA